MFDRDEVKDFDLFQLEKLKSELPYDAMGCESMVPKLVLQEFQKDSIAEDIMDFLEKPDSLDKEELLEEIQRFINVTWILKEWYCIGICLDIEKIGTVS